MAEHAPSIADIDSTHREAMDTDPIRRENALIGYQMAIALWTNQGNQYWARFNAMLVVNGIILAAINLASNQRPQPLLTLLLPIAGLLICVIWFILTKREGAYSDCYILSARELEEKYLSDPIKTVSRGGLFAEGKTITVEISGKPIELHMGRLARLLNVKAAAKLTIIIVAVLYIAAIVQRLP
jgi:carbon starvation protein CstA